jgi:hypothetical protein
VHEHDARRGIVVEAPLEQRQLGVTADKPDAVTVADVNGERRSAAVPPASPRPLRVGVYHRRTG